MLHHGVPALLHGQATGAWLPSHMQPLQRAVPLLQAISDEINVCSVHLDGVTACCFGTVDTLCRMLLPLVGILGRVPLFVISLGADQIKNLLRQYCRC